LSKSVWDWILGPRHSTRQLRRKIRAFAVARKSWNRSNKILNKIVLTKTWINSAAPQGWVRQLNIVAPGPMARQDWPTALNFNKSQYAWVEPEAKIERRGCFVFPRRRAWRGSVPLPRHNAWRGRATLTRRRTWRGRFVLPRHRLNSNLGRGSVLVLQKLKRGRVAPPRQDPWRGRVFLSRRVAWRDSPGNGRHPTPMLPRTAAPKGVARQAHFAAPIRMARQA
jgi:hypothetical protein